jgi:hypothetical protein
MVNADSYPSIRVATRAIAFSAFRPLETKEGISAAPFSQEI